MATLNRTTYTEEHQSGQNIVIPIGDAFQDDKADSPEGMDMLTVTIAVAGNYVVQAISTIRNSTDQQPRRVGTRLAQRIDNNSVRQLGVTSYSHIVNITGTQKPEFANVTSQYAGYFDAGTQLVLQAVCSEEGGQYITGSIIAFPI